MLSMPEREGENGMMSRRREKLRKLMDDKRSRWMKRMRVRRGKLMIIIEANIRWHLLSYMRVIEPVPNGDDGGAERGQK